MSLNEIFKKIVKDFDNESVSKEKIDKILDSMDEGHKFILDLIRDKKNFERLKSGRIFDGNIDDNKRGWLMTHNFPITLEILNRELLPGRKVHIPNMGTQAPLLVYHAICPELENFVSLIVWLNSESSKNAWNHIADLVEQEDETRVLQFSEKCGIQLPNKIHPSFDRDSKLVERTMYESLYNWKYAYYLFDDGYTIMSQNSPINFRRVVLDQTTREESFIGIRTTVGRLSSINENTIEVWTPCLNNIPRKWKWELPKKIDKSKLKINQLYFFQLFKKTGEKNIETFVRAIDVADPIDIVGMFLAQSLYLLYLGSFRLKLVNTNQFEKLFNIFYNQSKNFCSRSKGELELLENMNWKFIQNGFTNDFTKWIDNELYFFPPILRRYISNYTLEQKEIIIKQFDQSLFTFNHNCFEKNPYDKNGNRVFSSRMEMSKFDRIYDFIHFLLRSKRLILGIEQNPNRFHERDEETYWLKNIVNSN